MDVLQKSWVAKNGTFRFIFFELGSHLGSQLGSQQTTPREREIPPFNALFLLESGFFDEVRPPLIPETAGVKFCD